MNYNKAKMCRVIFGSLSEFYNLRSPGKIGKMIPFRGLIKITISAETRNNANIRGLADIHCGVEVTE
jgi:hypothetical protein